MIGQQKNIMTNTLVTICPFENDPFLPYCAVSIDKFCSGFDDYVFLCHPRQNELNLSILQQLGYNIEYVEELEDIGVSFLWPYYMMMVTDRYIDSDYISIFMSNFLFVHDFDSSNLFLYDKPLLWFEKYSTLSRQQGYIFQFVQYWQESTEKILHIDDMPYEFARILPIAYPHYVFREVRDHLCNLEKSPNFVDYINTIENLSLPNGFVFSSFNVVGAYLYLYDQSNICWRCISDTPNSHKYMNHVVGLPNMYCSVEEVGEKLAKMSDDVLTEFAQMDLTNLRAGV